MLSAQSWLGSVLPDGLTDGVVGLRVPRHGDSARIVSERDEQSERFLGPGSPDPNPTACIIVADQVVGWIDYDDDRDWLEADEVNVGYSVFPSQRGSGYGTRALRVTTGALLGQDPPLRPTLLIDPENARSIALAKRAGFVLHSRIGDQLLFKRPDLERPRT